MKHVVWVCGLLLCGCASTQLTYNVLDVASTTSQLAREQVLHNLAQFIDSKTATPAQVVFGQGTVSTENSVSTTLADPLTKTIAATASFTKSAAGAVTGGSNQTVGTTADKSLSITGGNTANQSWGIDTIGDPDVLRRLYDLYRFAVDGNDCPFAQLALLRDYPLAYNLSTSGADGTAPALTIDPNSMLGSNCVLCSVTSASASPTSLRVCDGTDGSETVSKIESGIGACEQNDRRVAAHTVHRLELKGLFKRSAGSKSATAASSLISKSGKVCLAINRRLLPRPGQGRWLLWEPLPGASRPVSIPAPDHAKDVYLGLYGHYALYIDGNQPERLPEFVIFITAASVSVPNPSSEGAANGTGKSKAPSSVLLTSGGGR